MDLDTLIASRLIDLRKARGMSIGQLAEVSNVSKAMISKIERVVSSPTATVLGKLAAGLGVPLADIVADREHDSKALRVRASQDVWQDPATGYVRRQVSERDQASGAEMVEIELPGGISVNYPPWSGSPYRQRLWLVEGTLEVTYGADVFVLHPGDRLDYGVDRPLTYRNLDEQMTRYLLVLLHGQVP